MKKMQYYFLFLIWYIVLLILGDTFLNLFIYAVGALILLSIYLSFKHQTINNFSTTFFTVFIFVLLLSTIGSVNLPISLQKVAFYLLAVLVFIVFSVRRVSWQKIMRGLQFVGITLCFLSLFMTVVSDWGYSIPGFNILVSTYGHNHLSIFLLAILPFSWYQALFNQEGVDKSVNWELIIPIAFSLMVLFSFGRAAVFLGLAQLIFIFFFMKKRFASKTSKKISRGFVVLIVIFLIIFGSKILLGILLSEPFSVDCPFPKYQLQLCKPLDKEARPHYWKNSILAIKEVGYFGTGPGTYQFTIQKHFLSPKHETAHAHNTWLEVFVELGMIGGTFFLLMVGYLFALSASIVKKKHSQDKKLFLGSLLLGVMTLLINAFADFDLSFTGIFVLLFLLLAIIIGNGKDQLESNGLLEKETKKKIGDKRSLYQSLIIFVSSIYIICYAALYGVVELLRIKDSQKAFDFFPYISWHSVMFAEDFKDNEEYLDKLIAIHQNNPVVIGHMLTFDNNLDRQMELKAIAAQIDPWSVNDLSLFEYYLKLSELTMAFEELSRLDQQNLTFADPGSWLRKNYDYADVYMKLADVFFQAGDYKMSGRCVAIAQQKNNWIIDKHPITVGDNNAQMSSAMYEFFYELKDIHGEYYGYHRIAYAQAYSNLVVALMKDHHYENAAEVIGKLPELADWLVDENLSATINYFDIEENQEDQLLLLDSIYQVKEHLSDETSNLYSLIAKEFVESAETKGDEDSESRFQEVQKSFVTAN